MAGVSLAELAAADTENAKIRPCSKLSLGAGRKLQLS